MQKYFAHQIVAKNGIRIMRQHQRQIWTPKAVFSMGKVASRVAIAGGGSALAGISYYGNKFKEWGEETRDNLVDLLKGIRIPDMDFGGVGSIFADLEYPKKAHNASFNSHSPSSDPSEIGGDGVSGGDNYSFLKTENHFALLTKRLIEVRNILKTVDKSDAMTLPSIVVVGSQSSGKSSLLESIIGHEILPKGNNMVTRRPVEITLISTPSNKAEYAEFPLQGLKITDFDRIKIIIKELNDSVSDEECVSDVPIDLRIYSPNVPDLTLIDLPGYIAINTKDQPEHLKHKIQKVCRKYIKDSNVILAVCAADVDLANSEALNEAKAVDPFGERTVGVLTKIDLVRPETVGDLLSNKNKYQLHLGYYGVMCKDIGSQGSNKYSAMQNKENAYFREHSEVFSPVAERLGINVLRTSLMRILEKRLSSSLQKVIGAVRKELDETRYQFKVVFNDQFLSPETYTTQILSQIKHEFKNISLKFDRPELREKIRKLLDAQVLNVCYENLWSSQDVTGEDQTNNNNHNSNINNLKNRLRDSQNLLTKSGLGRVTTQHVIDLLMDSLKEMTTNESIQCHKDASKMIITLADEMLKTKMYVSSDQVENAMKPLKYDLEFTSQEWDAASKRCLKALETELKRVEAELEVIKANVGWRKLRSVMQYVTTMTEKSQEESQEQQQQPKIVGEKPFSDRLMDKAKTAIELRRRADKLNERIGYLRPFSWWTNWYPKCCGYQVKPGDEEQLASCAEPYLFLISEKLAQTAVMFIWIELLNEFFYQYPLEIDNRLYYQVSKEQLNAFAREDKTAEKHLKLLEKKTALETAMDKLMSVQNLS